MTMDLRVANTNRQEDVAATDNRLVCVVGVQMKALSDEDSGKYVAGRCYALASFATYA